MVSFARPRCSSHTLGGGSEDSRRGLLTRWASETTILDGRTMFRIVLSAYVLVLIASPAAMASQAHVILLGAKIITSETKQTTAEAIALAGESESLGVHVGDSDCGDT